MTTNKRRDKHDKSAPDNGEAAEFLPFMFCYKNNKKTGKSVACCNKGNAFDRSLVWNSFIRNRCLALSGKY